MRLVFSWIQACWKWTQARLLVENHWFKLLEMGNEFRKIVSSWSELWNKVKEVIDSWAQVDSELWSEIMREVINKNPSENMIYDGFIRNDWNKIIFDDLLSDYKVIFFELDIETAKRRLLWRMFDAETGETFPSWTIVNPKNGNILVKRDDDKDEKAILKRISEYEEKTLPIIDEQIKEWRVIKINANQPIEDVQKELVTKLWL